MLWCDCAKVVAGEGGRCGEKHVPMDKIGMRRVGFDGFDPWAKEKDKFRTIKPDYSPPSGQRGSAHDSLLIRMLCSLAAGKIAPFAGFIRSIILARMNSKRS
jgi:hypothetical protein